MGNFKVYKSSAGSGKTFTLVKEFLKHCLKGDDYYEFSRILAITFTNKATFEMKARIMKALKQLSEGGSEADTLKKILLIETSLSETDLAHKCRMILTSILHHYADFSISTIDKFTHRVIRTFSKDLNLSPVFKVELDEKALLAEVVDTIIDHIGKDDLITSLILRFTFQRMQDEKAWRVNKDLMDFSSGILQEKAMPYLIELRKIDQSDFEETIKKYNALIKGIEKKVIDAAERALKIINREGIENSSFSGNSKISVYFEKLSKGDLSAIAPSNQLQNNIENDKWTSGKCPADEAAAIEKIKPELLARWEELQVIREKEYPVYLAAIEIIKPIYNLALLNQIEKKLAEYKVREKVLNISDFNRIIARVVMNEPMPFIYERLGERYRHIMIDEFQDTSVLQFMNLLPLIEESLANGNENLIVGDAKQAIYRFRGGEVEQFSGMPDYTPELYEENALHEERLIGIKSQYENLILDYNYRSKSAVVNFNNSFFCYLKARTDVCAAIKSIFDAHEQQLTNNKNDGYVEINLHEPAKGEDRQQLFHDETLKTIRQCLEDGYKKRDIAILFRKRDHASAMADFLKENQYDIISSEALLLKNDESVSFLIDFARWVFYPYDHLAKKNLVEFIYKEYHLKESLDDYLLKYCKKNEHLSVLFEEAGLEVEQEKIRLKSPHEFFEACIRAFQFDKTYNLYIQFLQDVVLDFTKSMKGTLAQFLEWWDEKVDSLSLDIPDDLDAIQLMTIHKSKGLEFPVVIFPYADLSIKHSGPFAKSYLWTRTLEKPETKLPYALVEFNRTLKESVLHEVYEEEFEKSQIDLINTAYVAFTRAADRLYIHTEKNTGKTERIFNLPDLLAEYVSANDMEERHEGVFYRGNLERKKESEPEEKEVSPLQFRYISEEWSDKLQISLASQSKWEERDEVRYGVLIHEILGKIHDKTELDKVLQGYLLKGMLSGDEVSHLRGKLTSIFSIPELEPFYSLKNKIKNEASLLTKEGQLLRPDRVEFFNDKVVVLDYKTGAENESHHKQVNKYIHALKEINPIDTPVEGYILYTENERLAKV